jgi:hypothetical protein
MNKKRSYMKHALYKTYAWHMYHLLKRRVTRGLTCELQVLDPDPWESQPPGDLDPRVTYATGILTDQLAGTRGSW